MPFGLCEIAFIYPLYSLYAPLRAATRAGTASPGASTTWGFFVSAYLMQKDTLCYDMN